MRNDHLSIAVLLGCILLAGCTVSQAPVTDGSDQNPASEEKEQESLSEEEDDEDDELLAVYEIDEYRVKEKVEARDNFKLIDVRESAELAETGVIQGTVHIPLGSLSLDTLQQNGIAKTDEIVVYCRSGNRSKQAYDLLTALGFTNVKSMKGGIIHWQEEKFPLVPWTGNAAPGTGTTQSVQEGARIAFDRVSEDLGMVGKTEVKSTTFTVSNTGTAVLEIGTITTSCACTSATIAESKVAPGASTVLTVTFDPNVHEEPIDKFKRTVFLKTNDPTTPEAEVSIWVDIDESSV